MNPRVQTVTPLTGHQLELHFENGEVRQFDVTPYLEKGFFRELQSPEYFNQVKHFMGTVQWPNGQDFCPDMLYEASCQLQPQQP